MSDTRKAQELLRAAAENVADALDLLDTASHQCGGCKATLYTHRAQGRVHEMLAETPAKLTRAANRLRNADAGREDTDR